MNNENNNIQRLEVPNINNYEPQRCNRFIIEFPENFEPLSYFVHSFNRGGKYNGIWDFMSITFNNIIGPSTTILINNLLNKENDFDIKLKILDPVGLVVETWLITVELQTLSVNYGAVSYDDNGIIKTSISFRPLNVIFNPNELHNP
jgi:hypothetical protein